MNKKIVGNTLAIGSLVALVANIIVFFVMRGPNANTFLGLTIFGSLSIIGIALAVGSYLITKRNILVSLFGLLGNTFVLGGAFLLLISTGLGEM